MAIFQIKKYKIIKDENGNKVQVQKTKEEWNKETKNGTATWYFSERYQINGKTKQYKSGVFALKRDVENERSLFLINPIEYIKSHSKRAKNGLNETINTTHTIILDEYFNDFIEYELNHNKESTVYDHIKIWNRHFRKDYGKLNPNELTMALTQEIHESLNKKINPRTNDFYSTSTKNTFHSTLVSFFNYLCRKGLIEMNYAKIIGSFKNPNINKNTKPKIKYQTLEQYELFMSVVDNEFWYTFFNFLFWHGPRKGEQRALRICDIDLEHNSVHFHKTFSRNKNGSETIGSIKNGKERITYLAEQTKPYIVNLINFYKQMDGYTDEWFLFGGPFSTYKNRIEDALKKYYNILKEKYSSENIKELTHHEFGRHSHASFLLNVGCDRDDIYFVIAQRLGDTEEVIRNTYAKPYESLNNDKTKLLLNEDNIRKKLNTKGENVT